MSLKIKSSLVNSPDARRILLTAGLTLAVSVSAGCGLFDKGPPDDALAVVGDEWLTRAQIVEELRSMQIDSVDDAAVARYVNMWVDRKLLLNEALAQNLRESEIIKQRLAELESELLIAELIERNTVVDTPSARQIVEYWKNHTGEYTRVNNEVSIVIASVNTKNDAWRIRDAFDQSVTADQMFDEMNLVSIDTMHSIDVARLPIEIQEEIEPLRSGHASLPVEYRNEWMIVKVLERFRAGRARPVEEVEDLVRARMIAEERARRKYDFIEALRRDARKSGFVRIRVPGMQDSSAATNTAVNGTVAETDSVIIDTVAASPDQLEKE